MNDDTADRHAPAGLTTERVAFFTDAVFAIAMTLLVIEIPRPEAEQFVAGGDVSKREAVANLWHFLTGHLSFFYAYLLAFFILWIVWRQHHLLLDRVGRMSHSMVAWHYPLLLLIGFQPYSTALMGHFPTNPLAALLFGLSVLALLFCRSVVQTRALVDEVVLPDVDRQQVRIDAVLSWLITAYWALTLTVFWWTPWVSLPWFLAPVVARVLRPIVRARVTR